MCRVFVTIVIVQVEEGSTLMILEAMKMQMPLLAPMTGKVSACHVLRHCCYKLSVDQSCEDQRK